MNLEHVIGMLSKVKWIRFSIFLTIFKFGDLKIDWLPRLNTHVDYVDSGLNLGFLPDWIKSP